MKKIFISRYLCLFIMFVFTLFVTQQLTAQTPGLIIKPASGSGLAVLDPDGDGYVSQKTNGIQLGFTIPPNNDVNQSEIPYVAIIRPDPTGDILRGPVGAFIEIVGVDAAGNNAILTYNDGTNLLYRFRLGGYAPNSKSYSLMIDTDGKFGFTGANADPNAVTGNPGFEVEIVLETNFNVKAYNVNGTTSGTLVASYSYDTNCQKSIAVSLAGGDPDYFYDFYMPFSSLNSLLTSTTPIRTVAVTVMNPHAAIGNNALSDVGGVTTGSNLDAIFEDLINDQTPTIPGEDVLDRSACPQINPVSTLSTAISGTSTEASGTNITVNVYQSDGVTLLGSKTTTITGSDWTIAVLDLSPAVALTLGHIVKATATASGKGTSLDNCNMQTVTSCAGNTSTTGIVLNRISGGKGYTISNSFPAGTIFTWYNADFTLAVYPDKTGSLVNIANPQTSTSASQIITFSTQTGQTFPNNVFYFTFQEPGKCVSSYLSDCQYAASGTSIAPVISAFPLITTATTSLSGTCGVTTATLVSLYADGIFLKSTTSVNSTNWTISGLDLSNYSCANITASAADAGKCPTISATGVKVTHPGLKPAISTTGCLPTSPVTSISGYSNDADGTVITLYDTNPTRSVIGSTTVSNGSWTVSSLNLASGDIVVAAATSGGCLTTGPDSEPITIFTQTSLSSYNITINPPTEGQSLVSGTISGGSYPVGLKVYIDQSQIGIEISINGAGNWSVGGLLATDLYIGGTVNVTVKTNSSCESPLSLGSANVLCLEPASPVYTGGSVAYCVGGAGSIMLSSTESLVIYQLVDGSGNVAGPSVVGNGGDVWLSTNVLNSNLGPVYVKAFKLANPSCSKTSTTEINFDNPSPSPTVTFSNTSVSVAKGVLTADLPYSAKSVSSLPTTVAADKYKIEYSIAAKAQGFQNITSSIPIPVGKIVLTVPSNPALGSYNGTVIVSETSGTSCTTSYGFSITVYDPASPPVIVTQPYSETICSGSTTTLEVKAVYATGYQWQSATTGVDGPYTNITGANATTYTTAALLSKTYYRVIVSNANGNTISTAATINVTALPATGAISGNSIVCAGQSLGYSINSVSGATSYTWSYSGTNVSISGTSNSVMLNFASNAASGTLSVTANNACGIGTLTTSGITVTPAPVINNINSSICNGATFTISPVNVTDGIVPSGTVYSWATPVVTGGVTGGTSGSGASSITGTLNNPTSTIQTATYLVTPTMGSCPGIGFKLTISINPAISLNVAAVDATCNGGLTGSIDLIVSGGSPSYSYLWSGPGGYTANSQNLSGLAAGTYNLTVTDSKGCKAITSAVIGQPTAIIITPSVTNIACNGNNTGAISLTVSGGNPSYSYLWNDGNSSKDRTGLVAGIYSVVVTDSKGCTQTYSGIAVIQPTVISVTATASAISCNGGTSTITVTASGGTGILNYSLNNGSFQSGNTFSGISASATPYIITVKDANGCTTSTNVSVTQPTVLSLSAVVMNASCPGVSDGGITLNVSGGTAAYTFNWGGGITSQNRIALPAGSYSVTVTDTKDCTATTSITVVNTNANPVTPGTIKK